MKFEIHTDDKGEPAYVSTDDGFCLTSRAYNPETDDWMQDQLDPNDFPAIQTGRDMEFLVMEVNRLRRALFHQKGITGAYRKASGFEP